jgi:hypothetical protein
MTSPWWHYRGLHERRPTRLYLLAELARAYFPTVAKVLRPARSTVRRPHEKLRPTLSQLACTHAHETLLWASKGRGSRHTFNYNLINHPDPSAQMSSIWHIHSVPKHEKLHGYHPTQKLLRRVRRVRRVRRALLASSREGDLVLDPFCGSGTTGVAAKELGRFFVGVELEKEFCELEAWRIGAALRESFLCEISEQRWSATPVE